MPDYIFMSQIRLVLLLHANFYIVAYSNFENVYIVFYMWNKLSKDFNTVIIPIVLYQNKKSNIENHQQILHPWNIYVLWNFLYK